MEKKPLLLLFCLISFLVLLFFKTAASEEKPSWVKTSGKTLLKDNKPFRFIGATAVNLVFYDDWGLDVEKAIVAAKENNISVLRLYVDLGWGKDSDFDKIFDLASKHGIYIILVFTDCCCSSNYQGLEKYFQVHAPLCNITNKESISAFKRLIKQIIERKNSINGRLYRDDPVILAWEIANELEYPLFKEKDVFEWLNDISAYIKSLDSNHLVTIGINGRGLESLERESFSKMFDAPALDFLSFHFYRPSKVIESNNPKLPSAEEISKIQSISSKLLLLNKPVILGEFGFSSSTELNLSVRSNQDTADLYNATFKRYMDIAFSAGCSGAMFWGWGVPEEKKVPMWWSKESHSTEDKKFCSFLKKYHLPD